MNKNKKRHISRAKFGRIRRMAMGDGYLGDDWDNAMYANGNLCVSQGEFVYWMDLSSDPVQYYRKSIAEALS